MPERSITSPAEHEDPSRDARAQHHEPGPPPRRAAGGRLDTPASMVARIVEPDFEVDPRRAAAGGGRAVPCGRVARCSGAVARCSESVTRFGRLSFAADAHSGARRHVEATHGADEGREARPSEPILLAVLDSAEGGLVDARLRLQVSLAPSEPDTAAQDQPADGIESILLFWIARSLVPSHDRTLVDAAYVPRIKGSIAAYPRVSWRWGPDRRQGRRPARSARGKVGAPASSAPGPGRRPARSAPGKLGARVMLPMGITREGPRGRSKSSIKPVGRRSAPGTHAARRPLGCVDSAWSKQVARGRSKSSIKPVGGAGLTRDSVVASGR